jgi:uncharacterized protein YegJ (DUF2314 family)
MKFSLIGFILLVLLISCKEHKAYISKNTNGGDEVYRVEGDDEDMNKAIENARLNYPSFVLAFKNADSSLSGFSVKIRFDYGEGNGEHMWLSDLHYRGTRLFGVLDSDPVNIHSVHAGDSLAIDVDRLSDWMYVKNSRMVGGYTLKVLYNKMTEKEKKEFREQLSFRIE